MMLILRFRSYTGVDKLEYCDRCCKHSEQVVQEFDSIVTSSYFVGIDVVVQDGKQARRVHFQEIKLSPFRQCKRMASDGDKEA